MIYVLHGLYLSDEDSSMSKDVKLQDMTLVQYLMRSARSFPKSARFMSKIFDIGSSELHTFLGNLSESDVLVMRSLSDLASSPVMAIKQLDAMSNKPPLCQIFITSFSYRHPYASYKDQLKAHFQSDTCFPQIQSPVSDLIMSDNTNPQSDIASINRQPGSRDSKYSWALKEYAAAKRCNYPQVSFEDLTKYTGIPYRSILYHIKSTRGTIPERRPSRSITQEEIEEITRIKNQG